MGRRSAMSTEQRNQAIAMFRGGMSVRAIALHLGFQQARFLAFEIALNILDPSKAAHVVADPGKQQTLKTATPG